VNSDRACGRISMEVWERSDMRAALAQRDVGAVYRLLNSIGVSQRQISALTEQHQSEVSAIAQGHGRQVLAYDVLSRIADGLGIPRGYMGMAYSDPASEQQALAGGSEEGGNSMQRRQFLAVATKLAMGLTLTPGEVDDLAMAPRVLPAPPRVELATVETLRSLTTQLRAVDARNGGGSCQGAILAQVSWADALLRADCTDSVRTELSSAAAELKTLAGWAAHDLGKRHSTEATRLLTQALDLTTRAGNTAQAAIVLYHLGRVPLDNDDPAEALHSFGLGQILAQRARDPQALALLHAHQALAHAQLGDAGEAMNSLRRAEDEFTNGTPASSGPGYLKFFDAAALDTAAARVHSALGLANSVHRDQAIGRLQRACAEAPPERRRQLAFNRAWLAASLIAAGDFDGGAQAAHEAIDEARALRSPRLVAHFGPLSGQAANHQTRSDMASVVQGIRSLRAANAA